MSTSALAIMREAPQHNEATGARTSWSAPNGGTAWRPVNRSPAPGVDAPYCPANVGILDTTIHATRGQDLSTRTATAQPAAPTHSACANTGRNNELTNNSGPAWALAFVRSPLFACDCSPASRCCSFFVSETFSFCFRSRVAVDADNRVNELKNELKSRVLLFFRAGYPLGGDPREALRQTAGETRRNYFIT